MKNIETPEHETLFAAIAEVLSTARQSAYRSVNNLMVQAYWHVGRLIVEHEQSGKLKAEHGSGLLRRLSERLTTEFGKGYDYSNLRHFRDFYITFSNCDALRRNLGWTHYRILLRVENARARAFYEDEAVRANWSSRALERQIQTFYYERVLKSSDRPGVEAEAAANTLPLNKDPREFIKDPMVLDFLNIPAPHQLYESDLEQLLMDNLQLFMLELGRGFAFVARQQHWTVEGERFRIDLVFYNFLLKCFVLIDLKIGKLSYEDVGQMDMYVNIYEERVRGEDDNPTIGIILCSERNAAVAKYSVLKGSQQLFATKYQLYLPTEAELQAELERERTLAEVLLEKKMTDEEADKQGVDFGAG